MTPVNACRYCKIVQQTHGRQWVPGHGWHAWVNPTQEQIKARMIERRSNA